MTPPPPTPPEGPSEPRHLRSSGNTQDTTEHDLWAFSDDLELGPLSDPQKSGDQSKGAVAKDIPLLRERKVQEQAEVLSPMPVHPIRIDVNKASSKTRQAGLNPVKPPLEVTEGGFEQWEDKLDYLELPDLPSVELRKEPVKVVRPLEPEKPTLPVQSAPEVAAPLKPSQPEDDEFSPVRRENAVPLSLRPHLGLSKVEKVGTILLVALLLIGGMAVYMFSLHRLPTESVKVKATDFPFKGNLLVVNSAISYWRPPITTGPTPDVFRRGTQLLPVVELSTSADSAAVRVIYRDDSHNIVGDPITRAVHGKGSVTIAATAGFDDTGMHAAYRTGGSKPWTIEVLEAPTENSESTDFKKLFEMNISPTLR